MILFLLGGILCGLFYPFNVLFPDAKFVDIVAAKHFGLYRGDRLLDAWERLEKGQRRPDGEYIKRPFHNLKNLAIEWSREWHPYSDKFLWALVVWPWLIYALLKIIF